MKSQTIRIGFRDVTLQSVTGKVRLLKKNPNANVPNSFYAPVADETVTAKTTTYDILNLIDDAGEDHTLPVNGFDIACRDGQRLTVMSALLPGKPTGIYFLVQNHANQKRYFRDGSLFRIFAPRWWWCLITIGLSFLGGLCSGAAGVIFTALGFLALTSWRVSQFKSGFDFSTLVEPAPAGRPPVEPDPPVGPDPTV